MSTSSPEPIRIRTVDEAIHVIPHLLGFHPTESLVMLVVGPASAPGLGMTARVDLAPVLDAATFLEVAGAVVSRFPGADLLLVAFTDRPREVLPVLTDRAAVLTSCRVLDVVATDTRLWWTRDCSSRGCDEGHHLRDDSRVRAEMVYSGLAALPDRQTLSRQYAGPDRATLRRDAAVLARLREADGGRDTASRLRRLDELTAGDEGQEPCPDHEEALELAVCLADPQVAAVTWTSTDRDSARPMHRLWTRVVAGAPEEFAAAPLALCGLTAWLCGDGAIQSICLERLDGLVEGGVLGRALDSLHSLVLPPHAWDCLPHDPQTLVGLAGRQGRAPWGRTDHLGRAPRPPLSSGGDVEDAGVTGSWV